MDPGLRFDAATLESLAADWRADAQHHHTALPEHLSPCRIGDGPNRHRCSRHHADLVEGYRLARHAYALQLEADTLLWPTEVAEHRQNHPPVTLRTWLQQNRTRP